MLIEFTADFGMSRTVGLGATADSLLLDDHLESRDMVANAVMTRHVGTSQWMAVSSCISHAIDDHALIGLAAGIVCKRGDDRSEVRRGSGAAG